MAWFLCLTCAVRGPGAEIISGALPGPLSSTPWLETEHQNLPWKPGSRVQELGGWHRRGGAGDVKHPSLGLASCHRGGGTSPPPPTPAPLLAVHGKDGLHPQWEGFAISHKAAYRAWTLQCGEETPRFGYWLGQSWCGCPASLLGEGWILAPASAAFSSQPRWDN